MTETITVNSVDRSSVIQRKNVEWAESAYLGEIGQGKIVIDDVAGTISVPGWKAMNVEQSSSSTSRIFTGFTHRKLIRRGETYTQGAGREIEIATVDLNDLLKRYIIHGAGPSGGNRKAETIAVRLAWLLASDFLSTLVADFGAVTYSTVKIDKSDCRGKYPADVLAEMAKAASFNYYVRYKSGETLGELVFRDDNTSTADTCTLSISNVASDINLTTVFPPAQDAELTQDPEDVYSGVYAAHGRAHVYRTRPATATAFTARDGVTEDSSTRTDATASRDADTFLKESKDEEQSLPVTLRLRKSKVGLVQAGMRISTRMSHMANEGWDPAIYARILRKRVTQPLNTDEDYDLHLDLSPQEAAATSSCGYDLTATGDYWPLGFYQFDGWNWAANPSDGVLYYLRPGYLYPVAPSPGAAGNWNFPMSAGGLGAPGGSGAVDYWGAYASNVWQAIVVGPGTMTISTELGLDSVPRPVAVSWGYSPDAYSTYVGAFTTGDTIEFDIPSDDNCVAIVRMGDGPGITPGGQGLGFSGMHWEAA